MKTMTTRHLKRLNACSEQVRLFRDMFGSSVEVTETSFVMAVEVGLDVRWLLLKPIHDAYYAALKPIDDAYGAARKPIEDASDEELYRMLIEA